MTTQTPGASAPSSLSPIGAAKAVFGKHPEEVISLVKTGMDTLNWLGALFNVIQLLKNHPSNHPSSYQIKYLVAMGDYIASDLSNFLDCEHEQMADCLKAAKAKEGASA